MTNPEMADAAALLLRISLLAYLTMAAEIGGGALLLFGIGTRWVAIALIPLILGPPFWSTARLALHQQGRRMEVPGVLDRRTGDARAARGRHERARSNARLEVLITEAAVPGIR